jgi:hypothetical protein
MAPNKDIAAPIYVRNETDLFTENPIDVSLMSSGMVEYHPLSSLNDRSGPITFNIKGNDVHYIDCSEMALYLRVKFVDNTNANIPAHAAANRISTANNLIHSLFQQCSVYLNETQITPTTSLYAYRSYIETVLGYGSDWKDSQALAGLYTKDSNVSDYDDAGFIARNKAISAGKTFDLIGKPCTDICNQLRYIIPGIDMRISFHRAANDDFYMHVEGANPQPHFKCNILEARLLVRKHTVLPMILNQHLKLWESGYPCVYPMRQVDCKSYSLPIGTIQNTIENILNGILPDRIIIALCYSESMNGLITTSPFDFKDFGLNEITVSANGDQIYTQTFNIDVTDNRISEVYFNMFNALGLSTSNEGPNISMDEFTNGKLFFIFNLRHINDGNCLPRHGNVKIALKFKAALAASVNVICHADYQSTLYINNSKTVYFKDFSTSTF